MTKEWKIALDAIALAGALLFAAKWTCQDRHALAKLNLTFQRNYAIFAP
jgi:hypothetical protein